MDFLSILVELPVLLTTIAFLVLGFVVGRSWMALLPLFVWAVYFLGLNERWWGGPPGDFWPFALLLEVLAGTVAIVIGLLLRRLLRRVGTPH